MTGKLVKYGELTAQQLLAVEFLLAKRGNNATYSEIAEAVGVSSKTLERWRKQPEFQAELRRRSIEIMGESLPLVLDTLTRKAIAGNNKSIELYLKSMGILRESFDITARAKEDEPRTDEAIEREIEELQRQLNEISEGYNFDDDGEE